MSTEWVYNPTECSTIVYAQKPRCALQEEIVG